MKNILIALAGGVIVGGVVGFLLHPAAPQQAIVAGSTTAGGTFSTAHQYNIAVSPTVPGANATSSSILNPTGQDLFVTGIIAGCSGVGASKSAYAGAGLAALTLTVATSSTAAPATNGNGNSVGGGALTLSTSTAIYAVASTTALNGSSAIYNVWKVGSYMTFTFNATNTAACTVGVNAFSA